MGLCDKDTENPEKEGSRDKKDGVRYNTYFLQDSGSSPE
jgi:hypothetical protein